VHLAAQHGYFMAQHKEFAFLDCALRASNPSQPGPAGRSDTAVVPSRPTIMLNDRRPSMPQVTAVDDQFGTHRVEDTPWNGRQGASWVGCLSTYWRTLLRENVTG
jgi:hypothetical protein